MRVEVWFDYLCPWCYLAQDRADHLIEAHGAEVVWHPFELHPEIPPGGTETLSGRPGAADVIRELAAEAGLPLRSRRRSNNTRRVLGLSAWAADRPEFDRFHRGLFAAYWAEGADLEDDATLVAIAKKAGLDPGAATDALASDSGVPLAEASKTRAIDLGIGATPGWHFGDGVVFSGVHPRAVMDRIVGRLGGGSTKY